MNDRLADFLRALIGTILVIAVCAFMLISLWTAVVESDPRPVAQCPEPQYGVVDSRGIAVGPTGPAGNCFAAPTLIPPFTSSPRP